MTTTPNPNQPSAAPTLNSEIDTTRAWPPAAGAANTSGFGNLTDNQRDALLERFIAGDLEAERRLTAEPAPQPNNPLHRPLPAIESIFTNLEAAEKRLAKAETPAMREQALRDVATWKEQLRHHTEIPRNAAPQAPTNKAPATPLPRPALPAVTLGTFLANGIPTDLEPLRELARRISSKKGNGGQWPNDVTIGGHTLPIDDDLRQTAVAYRDAVKQHLPALDKTTEAEGRNALIDGLLRPNSDPRREAAAIEGAARDKLHQAATDFQKALLDRVETARAQANAAMIRRDHQSPRPSQPAVASTPPAATLGGPVQPLASETAAVSFAVDGASPTPAVQPPPPTHPITPEQPEATNPSLMERIAAIARRRQREPETTTPQPDSLKQGEQRPNRSATTRELRTSINRALIQALKANDVDAIAYALRQVRDIEISVTKGLYDYAIPDKSLDGPISSIERLNAARLAAKFHTETIERAIHDPQVTHFLDLHERAIGAKQNLARAEAEAKSVTKRFEKPAPPPQPTSPPPAAETPRKPIPQINLLMESAPAPQAKKLSLTGVRVIGGAVVGAPLTGGLFTAWAANGQRDITAGEAIIHVGHGAVNTVVPGILDGFRQLDDYKLTYLDRTINRSNVILQPLAFGTGIAAVVTSSAAAGVVATGAGGLALLGSSVLDTAKYFGHSKQGGLASAVIDTWDAYRKKRIDEVIARENFKDLRKQTQPTSPVDEILRLANQAVTAPTPPPTPTPPPAPKAAAPVVHTVAAGENLTSIAQLGEFSKLRKSVRQALAKEFGVREKDLLNNYSRDILTLGAIALADANRESIPGSIDTLKAGVGLRDTTDARIRTIVQTLKECGKLSETGHISPGFTPRDVQALLDQCSVKK